MTDIRHRPRNIRYQSFLNLTCTAAHHGLKDMKSNPACKTITIPLLALGLVLTIPAEAENRYAYPQAPQAGNHASDPAPPEQTFWQRFTKDLKNTGKNLGRAFNKTRYELNYSFHNSTTEFPKSNNLNRHQKRFSGHVRNRREAYSSPYQKPTALPPQPLPLRSPLEKKRPPRRMQAPTQTPPAPVDIVRPEKQPANNLPPAVNTKPIVKKPGKQPDTSPGTLKKPRKEPGKLSPPKKEAVAEKKPEAKKKPDYPLAMKTVNPGFVKSPYPPFALLDVRDIKPGGLAMEPDSDRIFRVPE
jgi:hypothetical protein